MSEVHVDDLADKANQICKLYGWERDWKEGGSYLHLEASEFVEALRGKGDDPPVDEAADVLFVLLSMLAGHGITASEAFRRLDEKCDALLDKKIEGGGLPERSVE